MPKPSDTLARLRARSIEAGRFVLPLEPVWAEKLTDAYSKVRQAELLEEGEERARRVAEAQAVVSELEASAGDNVLVFRFRRMSRAEYDTLVSRNPPTEAQRKEDDALLPSQRRVFDQARFGPDLVSSILIDPKMTFDEVSDLMAGMNDEGAPLLSKGEAETLINSAMAAALSSPRSLPRELTLP